MISFKNSDGEFYIPPIGVIGTGFFSGVWAYNGWNKLNYIIEEIKEPEKNLSFAVIGSLVLVTLFYLVVNIMYFSVLVTVCTCLIVSSLV